MIIRWMVRAVMLLIAVVAASAFGLWWILRPPDPLPLPPHGVVLSGVTLVEPGIERRSGRTLTVRGPTIESIREAGGTGPYAGRYVLPGLIDMHVHHPFVTADLDVQLFGLLFLAHGVTTVRDTGSLDGGIFDIRRRIRAGEFPGPRIFACGPILDAEGSIWPEARAVHDAADAARAVDEAAAAGADCIKAYSLLGRELLDAIRDAAHERNLPVIGHVPLWVPFEDARLDDVQHLTGVAEMAPLWSWPNTNIRDFIAGIAASWNRIDQDRVERIVRVSVEQGIAHTPTIVVWERTAELADYDKALEDPGARLLPRYYRELAWNPHVAPLYANVSTDSFRAFAGEIGKMKEFVRRLHEAGARIHLGSDCLNPFVIPGASAHEELRNLVESGFTIEEAWAAATRTAGESLHVPGLGRLREGAPADLLVFRADPTVDLDSLSTLEAVVADGRLYEKSALDLAAARYRRRFESVLYDRLSFQLAKLAF